MKTHYLVETDGVVFVCAADKSGDLRQVTPSGEDGGTMFPPFKAIRTLGVREVEALYRATE